MSEDVFCSAAASAPCLARTSAADVVPSTVVRSIDSTGDSERGRELEDPGLKSLTDLCLTGGVDCLGDLERDRCETKASRRC